MPLRKRASARISTSGSCESASKIASASALRPSDRACSASANNWDAESPLRCCAVCQAAAGDAARQAARMAGMRWRKRRFWGGGLAASADDDAADAGLTEALRIVDEELDRRAPFFAFRSEEASVDIAVRESVLHQLSIEARWRLEQASEGPGAEVPNLSAHQLRADRVERPVVAHGGEIHVQGRIAGHLILDLRRLIDAAAVEKAVIMGGAGPGENADRSVETVEKIILVDACRTIGPAVRRRPLPNAEARIGQRQFVVERPRVVERQAVGVRADILLVNGEPGIRFGRDPVARREGRRGQGAAGQLRLEHVA